MGSSPLQRVLDAGKQAAITGRARAVPKQYAGISIAHFAFLRGYDEIVRLSIQQRA